ncbi:MAG: Rieske (2Fe-2S) protein [Cellvibrionaceae bacterium]
MSELPEYFTVRLGDEEREVSRFCPHRAGRLDHGYINVKSRTVSCPLHRSVFSLDSGEQISGPACGSIEVKPLKATS